jgi:hypothetical protein
MDSPDDNEIRRRPSGQLPKRKTVDTISSLDEAWLHTLDRGVGDSPINEVILPLMRDCFFWRTDARRSIAAEGPRDRLTADIARYITQEPELPSKFTAER